MRGSTDSRTETVEEKRVDAPVLLPILEVLGHSALSPNSSGHLSLSLEERVDDGAVSACCEWETKATYGEIGQCMERELAESRSLLEEVPGGHLGEYAGNINFARLSS